MIACFRHKYARGCSAFRLHRGVTDEVAILTSIEIMIREWLTKKGCVHYGIPSVIT